MQTIPDCFYRISVKALVLDEQKRFLLVQEEDGRWELPGGGIDFGETPQEGIRREIGEEMGLEVTYVADQPCYFLTDETADTEVKYLTPQGKKYWMSNVLYLTKLKDLNFTASEECVATQFFTKEEALKINIFHNVRKFVELYDPINHL